MTTPVDARPLTLFCSVACGPRDGAHVSRTATFVIRRPGSQWNVSPSAVTALTTARSSREEQ